MPLTNFSEVFLISFSHNLHCFVLFQCIMLCYCYGSVSDHFGPSVLINLDLGLKLATSLLCRCNGIWETTRHNRHIGLAHCNLLRTC